MCSLGQIGDACAGGMGYWGDADRLFGRSLSNHHRSMMQTSSGSSRCAGAAQGCVGGRGGGAVGDKKMSSVVTPSAADRRGTGNNKERVATTPTRSPSATRASRVGGVADFSPGSGGKSSPAAATATKASPGSSPAPLRTGAGAPRPASPLGTSRSSGSPRLKPAGNAAIRPGSPARLNSGSNNNIIKLRTSSLSAWPSRGETNASSLVPGFSGHSLSKPGGGGVVKQQPASSTPSNSGNKAVQSCVDNGWLPTRPNGKPAAKSLVSPSTKLAAPSSVPTTSVRQTNSSATASCPSGKKENHDLVPAARKVVKSWASPECSKSRADYNPDAPSVSGNGGAAVRKPMSQQQAQRLMIAGFKRGPLVSTKPTECIVPEGLPVSPKTFDSKKRCGWITSQSDFYHVAYHDTEWGVPIYDDKLLFELVVLQGAQAELSWPTILARRKNFRAAFANFEPAVVANFEEKKILSLRADPSICFPEAKIRGAVENAAHVIKIIEGYGSFSKFLWSFVNHNPVVNHHKLAKQVPVKTPKSEALSKELVRRGFRFVGPTTMYSVMQAAGLVKDHLVTCFKHQEATAESAPPKEREEVVDLWHCISMPEWRGRPKAAVLRGGDSLNMYFMDEKRGAVNDEPVWAELPMIEEVREDELEKGAGDDDIQDGYMAQGDFEIPVC